MTYSENTIPKLFEIQNISVQKDSFGLRTMPNDLRCSSVVLNKTINDSPEKQQPIYRASSFVDNFRQLNKFNESIQMEEIVTPNDVEI